VLVFFPFEQRFNGVDTLAMTAIIVIYETDYLCVLRLVLQNKTGWVDRKTCVNADLVDDFILGFFPAFT